MLLLLLLFLLCLLFFNLVYQVYNFQCFFYFRFVIFSHIVFYMCPCFFETSSKLQDVAFSRLPIPLFFQMSRISTEFVYFAGVFLCYLFRNFFTNLLDSLIGFVIGQSWSCFRFVEFLFQLYLVSFSRFTQFFSVDECLLFLF